MPTIQYDSVSPGKTLSVFLRRGAGDTDDWTVRVFVLVNGVYEYFGKVVNPAPGALSEQNGLACVAQYPNQVFWRVLATDTGTGSLATTLDGQVSTEPPEGYDTPLYDPNNPPNARGPQGPQGLPGAAGPAGPAIWSPERTASIGAGPADYLAPALLGVGNWVTGLWLACYNVANQCAGLRFYWPGGAGAKTVRCAIWNDAGVLVQSVDVPVDVAGVYQGTFPAPVTLTDGFWRVGTWETTGTNYSYTTALASILPRYQAYPGIIVTACADNIGGFAPPGTDRSATQSYPVDLVMT